MDSFHHWAAFLKRFQEITILAMSMFPLAISIMAKLAIFGKNGHFGHNGHGQWQYVYDHYGYLLKDIQKCRSVVKTRHPYDLSIKSYGHFCEFRDFRPFFGQNYIVNCAIHKKCLPSESSDAKILFFIPNTLYDVPNTKNNEYGSNFKKSWKKWHPIVGFEAPGHA